MARAASLLLTTAAAALLVACGQQPMMTGCAAGNRSQCIAQVTTGAHFGCALLSDHSVWCWGRNDESQLGYASTDVCPETLPGGQTQSVACHDFPFQVVGLDHATAIASGAAHTCALRDDGTVQCWGANAGGQLGNGATLPSQMPVAVMGLMGATVIGSGAAHSCAVTSSGVQCWGADDRNQLGPAMASGHCNAGTSTIPCSTMPIGVPGVASVVELTAGAAHTCARTMDGHVFCWGDDRYGQLGNGMASATPMGMPQMVMQGGGPLAQIQAIAAGANHTCAVRMDGAVFCWGRDESGQLGSATMGMNPASCGGPCSPTPILVPGFAGVPSPMGGMDGGVMHGDGGAHNDSGVMMHDAGTMMLDAGTAMLLTAQGIAAGDAYSCARIDDGTVRCWGWNADGQLGDGAMVAMAQPPVAVIAAPGAASNNPLQSVASLAGGANTVCSLLADGSLRCWGSNEDGALGIGNTNAQSGPVPVSW